MMRRQSTPARLEAFSDGVIAVIITVMVLELKVPHDTGIHGLLSLAPSLAVYALSFSFTGIYWINHHHIIDRLKHLDHFILWANLFFLFLLSLLPFFTNYMVEHHFDGFSVAVYAASLLADGLGFTLLTQSIVLHFRHCERDYTPQEAAHQASEQSAEQRKGYLSVAMYLAAIPLALHHPYLALGCVGLVTLIWIVPTFMVKPRPAQPLREMDRHNH